MSSLRQWLGTLPLQWLCHADARQVSDLPKANPKLLYGLRPC